MIFFRKIGYMQGRLSNYKINNLLVYPLNPYNEIETASNFNLSHIEFITKEQVGLDKNNLIWNDFEIKKVLKKNKSFNFRNISFIDNRAVKKNILEALKDYQGRIKVTLVPNLTNICYGRGVGYKIEEIVLDEKTQQISATKIREQMRKDGKLK